MARATKKRTCLLQNGPYDGARVRLASPYTLCFTAKGMTGRYRPGKIEVDRDIHAEHPTRIITLPMDDPSGHLIWEAADG